MDNYEVYKNKTLIVSFDDFETANIYAVANSTKTSGNFYVYYNSKKLCGYRWGKKINIRSRNLLNKDEYLNEINRFRKLYNQGNKNNRGIYMTEMEMIFDIPLLNSEAYNKANPEVIELYGLFTDWIFDN